MSKKSLNVPESHTSHPSSPPCTGCITPKCVCVSVCAAGRSPSVLLCCEEEEAVVVLSSGPAVEVALQGGGTFFLQSVGRG